MCISKLFKSIGLKSKSNVKVIISPLSQDEKSLLNYLHLNGNVLSITDAYDEMYNDKPENKTAFEYSTLLAQNLIARKLSDNDNAIDYVQIMSDGTIKLLYDSGSPYMP